jgi:hypothetical protein
MRQLSARYFSPKSCLHHYLHMAEGNFRVYLHGERVRLKKYFYVLRRAPSRAGLPVGRVEDRIAHFREFVGALPRAPSPDLGALDALFRDALKEAWT